MVLRHVSRFWPIHVAGALLSLHAVFITPIFGGTSEAKSYFCLGLVGMFAVAGAWYKANDSSGVLWLAWRAWIVVLLIRAAVMFLCAIRSSGYAPRWLDFESIWVGSLGIALTIFAICSTSDEYASWWMKISDGLMAVIVSLLINANIFLPGNKLQPGLRFISFLLIITLFLTVVSFVAIFGASNTKIRRFHSLVFLYFVTHLIAALLINNVSYLHFPNSSNLVSLLDDIPALLFGCAIFLKPKQAARPVQRSKFTFIVQSSMPFALTVAAFGLAIRLIFSHPLLGICGIVFAAIASGVRAIAVRNRDLTRQEEFEARNAELEELTELDTLTRVGNRRSFQKAIETAWDELQQCGRNFSLVMIDVDYLKSVNDTYGHARGDAYLVAVSRVLHIANLRAGGHLSRIGGDEFAVIFCGGDEERALRYGERVQDEVAMLKLDRGQTLKASLSIGVATVEEGHLHLPGLAAVIEAADSALYEAKARGRGRVVSYSQV